MRKNILAAPTAEYGLVTTGKFFRVPRLVIDDDQKKS